MTIVDPKHFRQFARLLLAVLLATITWLALTPEPPVPSASWDKANHAFAFFVLAGLAQYSVVHRDYLAWLLLGLYGVAIEGLQWLTGYRQFEVWDMVADWVGILLFLLCSPLLLRWPFLKAIKTQPDQV